MEKNGKIIFIADAHIVDDPASSEPFFGLLEQIADSGFGVVFLGDIFELWIAFDAYEDPVHRRFLDWCRREKMRRMVGFIEGNHEFYVAKRHAEAFTWASDRTYYLSSGKVCLMHGDLVNGADCAYRLFRLFMRNPMTRFLVRLFGPLVGRPLSQRILRGLKVSNMKHKKNFPEKYFCRLADDLEKKQIPLCLMGHFHQEAEVRGICVLPAWEAEDGEVGVYDSAAERYYLAPWRSLFAKKG